ncbi:IQ domain-containing protein IQM3 isoform X2 [Brassica rapa]|uniref:IQ domain-containing protein IQM3 isoform X2 n=1 Tax=Brassica campestris TaxID=3711 RepID=UPI0004F1878D|nr:IQ domain-containing protein IQM3 isoform X2 [Brassica rapa]
MQVVANFDFQPSPFSHATGEMLISPVGHRDESFVNFTDALEGASDDSPPSVAAVKVQKVYRSYRTRRRLADSVVVAEELWWQAMDYARLNHSTISFFDYSRPETAVCRWNRVSLNASKVGKGLSIVDKAQKLAFQHWIEAIDPRHRYGHNLHVYYEEWCKADAGQPFFYWLDVGDGKDMDLIDCSRSKLKQQCIKYLGPQERVEYEYVIIDGKIVHKLTGNFLHTMHGSEGTNEKNHLCEMVHKASEDSENYDDYIKPNGDGTKSLKKEYATSCNAETETDENSNGTVDETKGNSYQRTLSGGFESPKADVPQKAMLQRINSKKQSKSLQLGHQLMLKWSTGAGPRIGCAADYPVQLRTQALEFVNLSPRYRTSTLSPTGRLDI